MSLTQEQLLLAISGIFSYRLREIDDPDNPVLGLSEIGIHYPTGIMVIRRPDGTYFKPNELPIGNTNLITNKYDIDNDILTADIIGSTRVYDNISELGLVSDPTYTDIYDAMVDNSLLLVEVSNASDYYTLVPNSTGGIFRLYKKGDYLYVSFHDTDDNGFTAIYVNTGDTFGGWTLTSGASIGRDLYNMTTQQVLSTQLLHTVGLGTNIDISTDINTGPFLSLKIRPKTKDVIDTAIVINNVGGDNLHVMKIPEALYGTPNLSDEYDFVGGVIQRNIKMTEVNSVSKEALVNNDVYKIAENIGDINDYAVDNYYINTIEGNKDEILNRDQIFKGADNHLYLIVELGSDLDLPVRLKEVMSSSKRYSVKTSAKFPTFNQTDTIKAINIVEVEDVIADGSGEVLVVADDSLLSEILEVTTTGESNLTTYDPDSFGIDGTSKKITGANSGTTYSVLGAITGADLPGLEFDYIVPIYTSGFLSKIMEYLSVLSESAGGAPTSNSGSGSSSAGVKIHSNIYTIENDTDLPFESVDSYMEGDLVLLIYNTLTWVLTDHFTIDVPSEKIIKNEDMNWSIGNDITVIHVETNNADFNGLRVQDKDYVYTNDTGGPLTSIPMLTTDKYDSMIDGFDLIYLGSTLIRDVDYELNGTIDLLGMSLPSEDPSDAFDTHKIYRRSKKLGRLVQANALISGTQIASGSLSIDHMNEDVEALLNERGSRTVTAWHTGTYKIVPEIIQYIRPSGYIRTELTMSNFDSSDRAQKVTRKNYNEDGQLQSTEERTFTYTNDYPEYGDWIII